MDCEYLVISFNLEKIAGIDPNHIPYFDVNSAGDTENPKFNYIRYLAAQFVKVNSAGENKFQTISLLYALIGHLLDSFLSANETPSGAGSNLTMFYSITEYIMEHYTEDLSLNSLAKRFSLSVPYLSSCFKKYMDTTFLTYYNEIRLSHTVNEMLTSEDSLEEIALRHGFHNTRNFVSLFKKKYMQLPSEYRRQHKINAITEIYQSKNPDGSLPSSLHAEILLIPASK